MCEDVVGEGIICQTVCHMQVMLPHTSLCVHIREEEVRKNQDNDEQRPTSILRLVLLRYVAQNVVKVIIEIILIQPLAAVIHLPPLLHLPPPQWGR